MKTFFHIEPDKPSQWMTLRYSLALFAIAIIAFSAFSTVGVLISKHKTVLSVINVAGLQRMLAQRTAFYTHRLVTADTVFDREAFLTELKSAKYRLEQGHLALTGKPNDKDIVIDMSTRARERYFDGEFALDAQMQAYLRSLEVVIQADPSEIDVYHPDVIYILKVAPGQLVTALDNMVHLYEDEGEEAFSFLEQLEGVFLSLTLLILTFEAFFIFRPMVNHVTGQMREILAVTSELEKAKNSLEETVLERTRALEEARDVAQKAQRSAEKASVDKSRFLAAAGHDLKQPLDAIGMFSGMLEKRAPDDHTKEIMKDMGNAQKSMRMILNSILSISKLEAGVVVPREEVFELQPMMIQLAREYRVSAQEKGLDLRYVPTSVKVNSDPLMVERVLRNFLSNAVRYTKKGRILLGCRYVDGQLSLEVWDTGPGIPAEGMDHIFKEFSQLDDPERDRSQGIGLGLAIVIRLASLLNLKVDCASEVTKGSKFAVLIPQDRYFSE